MAEHKQLTPEQIQQALASGRSRGPKADPTEPRDIGTWYKLNQIIREDCCENPNCEDPRVTKDGKVLNRGAHIVAQVKGKYMCRYCFLAGWLSDSNTAVI